MTEEHPTGTEQPTAAEEQPTPSRKSSGGEAPDAAGGGAPPQRRTLCRSSTDRVIAGVAGGIGAYFGVNSVIVRGLPADARAVGPGITAAAPWALQDRSDHHRRVAGPRRNPDRAGLRHGTVLRFRRRDG